MPQCWVTRWPKSTTRSPPTSLQVLSWQQNWRCWEQDGHRLAVDGEGALTRGRQNRGCVPAKALVCPLQIRVFRCTHLVSQDQKLLSRRQRRNHWGDPAASAAQPLSPVAEGESEPQGLRLCSGGNVTHQTRPREGQDPGWERPACLYNVTAHGNSGLAVGAFITKVAGKRHF